MNNTTKAALLQFMAVHARYGKLPEHLKSQESRDFLDDFFSAAISHLSDVESLPDKDSAEKLAQISLGRIEGEFV